MKPDSSVVRWKHSPGYLEGSRSAILHQLHTWDGMVCSASLPSDRDSTQERGGREPRHKRFIIWTCQQKRTVWTQHGKVHQSWMCYTNPFTFAETWAGFEVSHSYPFGPIWPCHHSQMVWRRMRSSGAGGGRGEGGIIFSSLQWPFPRWLSLSFLPRLLAECRGQHAGPRPLENTLFVRGGPRWTTAGNLFGGLLPASDRSPNRCCQLQCLDKENAICSFATVAIRQRFLWTWEHVRPDQKEALVGCLSASKSTHVCFPSPQTTVTTEIILHSLSNNLSCTAPAHRLGSNIWQLSTW